MSSGLSGKVVLVGSLGTSVGAAIAAELAEAGAQVLLADTHGGSTDLPQGVTPEELLATDEQSWASLGKRLAGREINGYVHCGRFGHHGGLAETRLEDWNDVLDINIMAAVLGLQTLVPLMPSGASVVMIGSSTAFTAFPSVSDTSAAWALRGLVHAADLELADRGIRINALHCGFLAEDLADAPPPFEDVARRATTRGRLIEHGDVAAFTRFLLADESDFMTSGDIRLDGGATAHAGSRMAKAGVAADVR